ncbi:MAG: hypothetical protein GY818_14665 [Planctomycetaceae bacterium]|nr:hypothetical protein [Planctomycetaceae bacterium]
MSWPQRLNCEWLKGFVLAMAWSVVLIPLLAQVEGQEFDRGFRDLGRVEPSELFQRLSVFKPDNSDGSKFNAGDLSDLRELATQSQALLKNLSSEKQEALRKHAQQYLNKNGLDSEASRALMRKLGVPNKLQESLAEKFKRMGAEGSTSDNERLDALSDALNEALPKSKKIRVDPNSKSLAADREGASRSTERRQGIRSSEGAGESEGEMSGAPGSDAERTNVGATGDKKQAREITEPRLPPSSEVKNEIAGQPREKRGKRAGENESIEDPLGLGTGVGNVDKGVGVAPRNSDAEANDLKFDSAEGAEKQAPEIGLSEAAPKAAEEKGRQYDWEEDHKRLGVGNSENLGSKAGISGDSQKSDELRDSKANGSIRRFADLAQAPLQILMNRDSNALDGESGVNSSGKDKPRLASVFDRTVVEAAKEVLESSADGGEADRGFFERNLDSLFKGIVSSTGEKRKKDDGGDDSPRFSSDAEGWDNEGKSGGRGGTFGSDWVNQARASRRKSNSGGRGKRQSSSEEKSKDEQPVATRSEAASSDTGGASRGIFTFLFGLGIAGVIFAFLFTLMNRRSTSVSKIISDRAVARRIDRANFQSSQDLIALVDLFLLNKFGSESGWWNAKHAENVLLSDAPEFETNINELVRSYVRMRYTRTGGELSQSERDNCRTTLKSLSKLLSKSDLSTRLKVEG